MTERRTLPNRRLCETRSIEASGLRYSVSVGWFSDSKLAELFIANHKNGSHADVAARDSAVVASIALQFGAPLDVLRNALARDPRGNALGPLGVVLDQL